MSLNETNPLQERIYCIYAQLFTRSNYWTFAFHRRKKVKKVVKVFSFDKKKDEAKKRRIKTWFFTKWSLVGSYEFIDWFGSRKQIKQMIAKRFSRIEIEVSYFFPSFI